MNRPSHIVATLLATLAVAAALAGAATASSDVEAGDAQSPIDIRRSQVTFVNQLPAIRFSYPRKADVVLNNTGSPGEEATVRADVPAGAASITLSGKPVHAAAVPLAHAGRARAQRPPRPMEMHLVHSAADGSLLVIGVLIEQGKTNSVLAPIFNHLPEAAGETHPVAGVKIDQLLPRRPVVLPLQRIADDPAVHRGRALDRAREADHALQAPDPRLPGALRRGQQPRSPTAQRPQDPQRRRTQVRST